MAKKNKNACFREDTKGVPGQPLCKEVTHAVHQTSQQKPGIELGFIPARDTASLDQREQGRDKIKEGCWTSGSL